MASVDKKQKRSPKPSKMVTWHRFRDFYKEKQVALSAKWQRFRIFVKKELFWSIVAATTGILALIVAIIPILCKPSNPEQYLALQNVENIPDSIFVGLHDTYTNDSLLFVQLYSNPSKRVQAEIQFEIEVGNFSLFTSTEDLENDFNGAKVCTLQYPAMKEALKIAKNQTAKASVKLFYRYLEDKPVDQQTKLTKEIKLIHKNFVDFSRKELLFTFLTPTEPELKGLAHYLEKVLKELDSTDFKTFFNENLLKAVGVFHWMKLTDIYLDRDLHARDSHYLQFPVETLSKKVGTSNDLAVLYATLLIANRVSSFVMPFSNHLFVFFDTGISKENYFFTISDENINYYSIDTRGNIWLPLDMNAFNRSFYEAWFESRNYDLPKDLSKTWMSPQSRGTRISHQWMFDDGRNNTQYLIAEITAEANSWQKDLRNTLEERGDEISLHKLAILSLEANDLPSARKYLQRCLSLNQNNSESYFLLGRTSFLEGKYYKAIRYFDKAISISPQMAKTYFWLACTFKSLHQSAKASSAYIQGKTIDPRLSEKFIVCNPDVE